MVGQMVKVVRDGRKWQVVTYFLDHGLTPLVMNALGLDDKTPTTGLKQVDAKALALKIEGAMIANEPRHKRR